MKLESIEISNGSYTNSFVTIRLECENIKESCELINQLNEYIIAVELKKGIKI